LSEISFKNHSYQIREKIDTIIDLYNKRYNLESLKRFEEFDLRELDISSSFNSNKLEKISDKGKNQNEEKINDSKTDNNIARSELDIAKIYNLKGLILLENGYFTKSQKYFKNASSLFSESLNNNTFHPLYLNNHYDEIYSNIYSSPDFDSLKNNLLEIIAKSKLIKNSYLIFKGYTYLALIHMHSGNQRSAKALAKFGISQLTNEQRKQVISNIITLKCLLLYINTNKQKIKNDKIVLNYEKELKQNLNFNNVKNKLDSEKQEDKDNLNKLSSQILLELFANKAYKETELSLSFNTLYKNLEKINDGIKYLEENNYNDNFLAMLYLKKWSIEILLGREATANLYLDESQKIINTSYGVDSFKNIEFLRSLIINSLNIYPPKIDIAKEILRKTRKITDEVNCNSLQQKFFNIAFNLRTQTGVSEVFNLYEDILNTNSKYFKKDSEVIFDIKDMLKSSRLAFVYKNKQEK